MPQRLQRPSHASWCAIVTWVCLQHAQACRACCGRDLFRVDCRLGRRLHPLSQVTRNYTITMATVRGMAGEGPGQTRRRQGVDIRKNMKEAGDGGGWRSEDSSWASSHQRPAGSPMTVPSRWLLKLIDGPNSFVGSAGCRRPVMLELTWVLFGQLVAGNVACDTTWHIGWSVLWTSDGPWTSQEVRMR